MPCFYLENCVRTGGAERKIFGCFHDESLVPVHALIYNQAGRKFLRLAGGGCRQRRTGKGKQMENEGIDREKNFFVPDFAG